MVDDQFTVDELKAIKARVQELGFPIGGNVETQVFGSLVNAYAQVKAAQQVRTAIMELRDAVKQGCIYISDSIDRHSNAQ